MLRALGGRESGGAVAAPKTAAELLGVPPPPKTGRDRLVDTAINLFYAHGYNAVGLDRILAEVGVTKTTFYKHFASKDDLMVEAVRRRHVWEQQAWERAVRKIAGDDPRGQLLALFDVMHTWFNDPDFKGCLFINTAAEFPNPHDPIHKAAAAHKRAARNGARDKALAAGAAPEKAERFADLFTLLVEGTLVMRQIHGRNDAAVIARGVAERLVDEYVPRQPPAATEAE